MAFLVLCVRLVRIQFQETHNMLMNASVIRVHMAAFLRQDRQHAHYVTSVVIVRGMVFSTNVPYKCLRVPAMALILLNIVYLHFVATESLKLEKTVTLVHSVDLVALPNANSKTPVVAALGPNSRAIKHYSVFRDVAKVAEIPLLSKMFAVAKIKSQIM
jgi:hypothetical protein